MGKSVELPIGEPFYGTYHFQGLCGAVSSNCPSVKKWYINEAIQLVCNKIFLFGFSSPHLNVENSFWTQYPYFEKYIYPMRFLNDNVNVLICELINNGYYVNFDGVDDYYLEGKTWYGKRHFCHDGLIFGYSEDEGTFSVYGYDSNWIYNKFKVKQESFTKGKLSMMNIGQFGNVSAVKPMDVDVQIDPRRIYDGLKTYLESSLEKYPMNCPGEAKGIVVHKYIIVYLDMLYEGLIDYDKMDWRVFRMLWEHKTFMLERLKMLEEHLGFDSICSDGYLNVVKKFNTMRALYSSHHQKRRDSTLPIIKSMLVEADDQEHKILCEFVRRLEEVLEI